MAQFPSTTAADGIWSLKQQRRAALGGDWPALPTDPNFADVSLLLHGDGTDGSTTLTDSSSNSQTITLNGSTAISTAQSKFGGASIAFDGNRDWLYPSDHTQFIFGTDDFTVEMWVYPTDVSTFTYLYDSRPLNSNGAYVAIGISSSGVLNYVANSAVQITGTTTVATNTWHHIAVSRSGTSTKMFLNGTQEGSTYTDSTNYTTVSGRPLIGANAFSNVVFDLDGYIDDLRITKGVARYTANFTPPTEAFPDQ